MVAAAVPRLMTWRFHLPLARMPRDRKLASTSTGLFFPPAAAMPLCTGVAGSSVNVTFVIVVSGPVRGASFINTTETVPFGLLGVTGTTFFGDTSVISKSRRVRPAATAAVIVAVSFWIW